MAKDNNQRKEKKQKPEKDQPLAIKIISFPFKLFKFLFIGFLGATVLSIIIEFIGLTFIWPDDIHHAQSMFLTEYGYIKENHSNSLGIWKPVEFMEKWVSFVYAKLTDSTISIFIAEWWNSTPTTTIGTTIKTALPHAAKYVEAIIFIILTIAMRVCIFVLSIGWFILCGILGIVYGMVQREIRKDEGGLEHSYVFHMAKSNLYIPFQFGWVVYLSSPFAIYPSFVIIPAGLIFGYLIALTASTFKKYL